MSRYLTNLAAVVARSGLDVVEEHGWQTRGHGPMDDNLHAVVCHHTAGPATGDHPSLQTVISGRPGLAGPLAHLFVARSGTVHVVAAGLCWHAGAVRQAAWNNRYAIGIEAEATGRDTWPDVQMDAYARLCAALTRGYGLKVSSVLGHKEVCAPPGRKVDPNFDMAVFRRRVQAVLDAPPPAPATGPGHAPGGTVTHPEADVPLTQSEIDAVAAAAARAVHSQQIYRQTDPDGSPLTIAEALLRTYQASAARIDPAAIAAAVVAALPEASGGLTPEQITTATAAGVRQVLGSLDNPA